jgi:Acetyltransferase (GNAT) family
LIGIVKTAEVRMSEIAMRAPTSDDWPAILALAELAVSEVPNAPSQLEWLDNRKSFSTSDGIQQHFLATSGERIVGYACIEYRNKTTDGRKPIDGAYRLFVVVAPPARRTLGTQLLAKLRECLIKLDARKAWMLEYEADAHFISYLEEMGFAKVVSFDLQGTTVVELTIDAPFQLLAPQT